MKHSSTILVLFLSLCSIVSYAQGKTDKAQDTNSMKAKAPVAFFSRTGENSSDTTHGIYIVRDANGSRKVLR